MQGHNICFMEKREKLSMKYHQLIIIQFNAQFVIRSFKGAVQHQYFESSFSCKKLCTVFVQLFPCID